MLKRTAHCSDARYAVEPLEPNPVVVVADVIPGFPVRFVTEAPMVCVVDLMKIVHYDKPIDVDRVACSRPGLIRTVKSPNGRDMLSVVEINRAMEFLMMINDFRIKPSSKVSERLLRFFTQYEFKIGVSDADNDEVAAAAKEEDGSDGGVAAAADASVLPDAPEIGTL